jgi:hypothetical protein
MKHTQGPWKVRKIEKSGEMQDCFVCAPDCNGYAYDAEILGEDEYHEQSGGLDRKIADCNLIAAAPELLESLKHLIHLATPNIYPSPDKENSAWAKLQRARKAVSKAEGK